MKRSGKLSTLVARAKRDGLAATVAAAARRAGRLLTGRGHPVDPVDARRIALFAELNARLGGTVRYGPFSGMKLPQEAHWGGPDRAPILLGLYEREVAETLGGHADPAGIFIDLGAADGYYGVGVLHAGWFRTSYCYEISEHGRDVIRRNAAGHGVADRVIVRGIAEPGFYRDFTADELAGAVILVDIEGGEFELLGHDTLDALRAATIIVEVHPWVTDGEARLHELRERADSTHRVSSFDMGARDPGRIEELRAYSDTDRWLICSESRPMLMSWLLLEPR